MPVTGDRVDAEHLAHRAVPVRRTLAARHCTARLCGAQPRKRILQARLLPTEPLRRGGDTLPGRVPARASALAATGPCAPDARAARDRPRSHRARGHRDHTVLRSRSRGSEQVARSRRSRRRVPAVSNSVRAPRDAPNGMSSESSNAARSASAAATQLPKKPPIKYALTGSAIPPAHSISSRIGIPSPTSYTPGRETAPATVTNAEPGSSVGYQARGTTPVRSAPRARVAREFRRSA